MIGLLNKNATLVPLSRYHRSQSFLACSIPTRIILDSLYRMFFEGYVVDSQIPVDNHCPCIQNLGLRRM